MQLLGDIGGTFIRLAQGDSHGHGKVFEAPRRMFATFFEALTFYLNTFAEPGKGGTSLETGAFAWASLNLDADIIRLGWAPYWETSLTQLKAAFGFRTITIINDIVAMAMAIPSLTAEDMFPLNGHAEPADNIIIVTPGTAFGAALGTWDGEKWTYMQSDIGFSSPPLAWDDRERLVFATAQGRFGKLTVSHLLSGRGLRYLYETICILNEKEPEPGKAAFDLIDAALRQDDPIAVETISIFLLLFWRTIENLTLTFRATGGIYIAGAIVRRLAPVLQQAIFLPSGLRPFPISLITHQYPALLGLQQLANVPHPVKP